MITKTSLTKLRDEVRSVSGERKVYLVFNDKQNNRMRIPKLNFDGTSEAYREIADKHPHDLFVILSIPRPEWAK